MTRYSRWLVIVPFAAAVLVMLWAVAAGRFGPRGLPTTTQQALAAPGDAVPAFSLLDQNGAKFDNSKLAGRVWIANFIFTRCQGPCPLMTRKMADLQASIADSRVGLLSFSVDPQNDTPAALKKYAQANGADESRWVFATGREGDVARLAWGLKLGVGKDQTGIFHTTRFVLIDAAGQVKGYYSDSDPAALRQLAEDARALAGQLAKGKA
jgi:cytochrome oxidase Cu insertion factor (SCO1/SenC/PrrC family)